MVTPFMAAMKKWIGKFKDARKKGSDRNKAGLKFVDTPEYLTPEENPLTNDQSFGFGNDYNSAIVPQNQRVEMEESLRNLLGMHEPGMFSGAINPVMNGMNPMNGMHHMNGMHSFHQQQMNPHIFVHQETPSQFYAPHNMQQMYQPQPPIHHGYPNAYIYPNQSNQPIQHILLQQPLPPQELSSSSDPEQNDKMASIDDQRTPPGEKNSLVDLLLVGSKTEEIQKESSEEKNSLMDLLLAGRGAGELKKDSEEKNSLADLLQAKRTGDMEKESLEQKTLMDLLVGAKSATPLNTEKNSLLDILMPPKREPIEDPPSLTDLVVTDRLNSTKKIISRPDAPPAKTIVKAEKKSPKKEKKKQLPPIGPEFGKVQILKRPNDVKLPSATASPASSRPSTSNTNTTDKSALQNILLGGLEPSLDPAEETTPVFKLKSSSKKDKPKKVITQNSPVVNPMSPDPGLEMALSGKGNLVTPHTPIDRALSSALSGDFPLPAPSPITKEKQSLMDILQGVPQPPVHYPVDESREIRSSRESRESLESFGRNSVTSGNGISTEKQEEREGLLSLLLGTGATTKSSSSSIPSPGSLSKSASQQNSLLDILKGIPSPPKNDE
jgi:hypothetical protein